MCTLAEKYQVAKVGPTKKYRVHSKYPQLTIKVVPLPEKEEIPIIDLSFVPLLEEVPSYKGTIYDDDTNDRYTFEPVKRPSLLKYYTLQQSMRWISSEINMGNDRFDFENASFEVRLLVKGIIGFFVFADGLVIENIFENFQKDTSFWKEAKAFYAEQNAMEMVHSQMYSQMASVLIRDENERDSVFKMVQNKPSLQRVKNFIEKYMDRSYSLLERIVAFACVEGVLFNSAFAVVYWIKKMNILHGFCKANEFVARDESCHTEFAIELYKMISHRFKPLEVQKVHLIIREAVEVNAQFIKDILPVELIGMNSLDLIQYTQCAADYLSNALSYGKIYNVESPFDWIVMINLMNRTNFFEDTVSEYKQSDFGEFVFDEDAYF